MSSCPPAGGSGSVLLDPGQHVCHPELVSGSAKLDPGVIFPADRIIPILNNTATGSIFRMTILIFLSAII
ncbi:MAG: hypothetical protein K9N05_07885 [Candidatus Marinimicrobia bacterium]|nr:hypothetical protein [Candidatus Neomarinimicrobiota bacterium]